MSTIHFHQTTTLTPEQYIAGLTDFGPGRSKLLGNVTLQVIAIPPLAEQETRVP